MTAAPVHAGLDLAPQQRAAVEAIYDWYQSDEQIFRMFGYAGTGKTTLAKHIVDGLGTGLVLYAAYTGKAAYVLRTKGCDDASTIHSLIYQPQEKARAKLLELRAQLADESDPTKRVALERAIAAEEERLADPSFVLRVESELADAALLVLDEVSMVDGRTAGDLLSFGTKILCLGDPAQLPPVEGGGYFINHEPDALLTEIHRSALDSPVTRLATAVRNSPQGDTDYGVYGPDGDSGRHDHITIADLLRFDQVLVGTNATRWQVVHLVRALTGLLSPMPMVGDRVIVLANSNDAGVFNGQQFEVLAAQQSPGREDKLLLEVRDDEDRVRTLETWTSGFKDLAGEKLAKRNGRGSVVAATFGQAITVHKSQGSQWDNVLVIDEASVFARGAYKDHVRVVCKEQARAESHLAGRRWLYTAVTRAAQRVVIVPGVTGLLS